MCQFFNIFKFIWIIWLPNVTIGVKLSNYYQSRQPLILFQRKKPVCSVGRLHKLINHHN